MYYGIPVKLTLRDRLPNSGSPRRCSIGKQWKIYRQRHFHVMKNRFCDGGVAKLYRSNIISSCRPAMRSAGQSHPDRLLRIGYLKSLYTGTIRLSGASTIDRQSRKTFKALRVVPSGKWPLQRFLKYPLVPHNSRLHSGVVFNEQESPNYVFPLKPHYSGCCTWKKKWGGRKRRCAESAQEVV